LGKVDVLNAVSETGIGQVCYLVNNHVP